MILSNCSTLSTTLITESVIEAWACLLVLLLHDGVMQNNNDVITSMASLIQGELKRIVFIIILASGNRMRPLQNAPFCPISVSGSNFNPQNTKCIPVVKIFAFLELEQN